MLQIAAINDSSSSACPFLDPAVHLYFITNGSTLQLEQTVFLGHRSLRRRDFRWTEGIRGLCYCLLSYKATGNGLIGHRGSQAAALDSAVTKGLGLVRIFGGNPARYFERVNSGLKDPHAPVHITPLVPAEQVKLFVDGIEVAAKDEIDVVALRISGSPAPASPALSAPLATSKLAFGDRVEYISNVNFSFDHFFSLIESIKADRGPSYPVKIRMIALDMECAWPRFKYDIFSNPILSDISLDVLMLSPFTEGAKQWSPSMLACSRLQYADALSFFSAYRANGHERNMGLEIRGYRGMPVLHGCSINDMYYFLALTSFQEGALGGGDTPYLILGPHTDKNFRDGMVKCFSSWFSHLWRNGEQLVQYPSQDLPCLGL